MLKRFFESLNAKACIHGVRQAPSQHFAVIPVDNRNQVQEPLRHWDIRDINLPRLIWVSDFDITQQVGINLVCFVRQRRLGLGVNSPNTYIVHDPNNTLTINAMAIFSQLSSNTPTAHERILR